MANTSAKEFQERFNQAKSIKEQWRPTLTECYYRTYIIEFKTSSGYKIYAGKRTSTFKNPEEDKYRGSGIYIKRSIRKYGLDCIESIQWFDHEDEDTQSKAEIELIKDMKNLFGKACVNIHEGGVGGYTSRFASEEQLRERSRKISEKLSKYKGVPKPKGHGEAVSKAMKGKPKSEEHRKNLSKAHTGRIVPESVKETLKRSKRKGKHWELYDEIFELWLEQKLKSHRFRALAKSKGYPDVEYNRMVKSFELKLKEINGE